MGTFLCMCPFLHAQELDAKVVVTHLNVDQSSSSVFEDLQKALNEFINNRQWTNMQFRRNERIACTFNITVNEYSDADHHFACTLRVQATRPVFNSSYTTVLFSTQDDSFNFNYQEFDNLDFRADVIDNELTALIAYYVYLIIGLDEDAMSPEGGTDYLEVARTIVNNSQSLSSHGWKAFNNLKNRYTIINDMLDNSMSPFRQLQYKYFREGLDTMAENAERGRATIAESIGLLTQAHENKPLSELPELFTEYKSDELIQIFKGKGTSSERESVVEQLTNINASKSPEWAEIID
ncbi:MAG: DUF4835 family protein [Alloprevotella sp.]|nr:DUF4835 family protein [Alloprevotella sp.]